MEDQNDDLSQWFEDCNDKEGEELQEIKTVTSLKEVLLSDGEISKLEKHEKAIALVEYLEKQKNGSQQTIKHKITKPWRKNL